MASEIQDAMAVVSLMGRSMITTAHLASWILEHMVHLAIAAKAHYDAHKYDKGGSLSADKFFKEFDKFEMVSMPAGLSEEKLKQINGTLEQLGINYTIMPYKSNISSMTIAVPAGNADIVTTIFEQYKPKIESMEGWVNGLNKDAVKLEAEKEASQMTFTDFKDYFHTEDISSCIENINGPMTRNDIWITMDIYNPKNFVRSGQELNLNPRTGEMELYTNYDIFLDGKKCSPSMRIRNGNKVEEGELLKRITEMFAVNDKAPHFVNLAETGNSKIIMYYLRAYQIDNDYKQKEEIRKANKEKVEKMTFSDEEPKVVKPDDLAANINEEAKKVKDAKDNMSDIEKAAQELKKQAAKAAIDKMEIIGEGR